MQSVHVPRAGSEFQRDLERFEIRQAWQWISTTVSTLPENPSKREGRRSNLHFLEGNKLFISGS